MEEKKPIKINFTIAVMIILLLVVILEGVGLIFFYNNAKNSQKNMKNDDAFKSQTNNEFINESQKANIVSNNVVEENAVNKENVIENQEVSKKLTDSINGKLAFDKLIKENELRTEEHGGYYAYIDGFQNKYNIKEIKDVSSKEDGILSYDEGTALFKVGVRYLDNNDQIKNMELAVSYSKDGHAAIWGTWINYTGTTGFVKTYTDLYDYSNGNSGYSNEVSNTSSNNSTGEKNITFSSLSGIYIGDSKVDSGTTPSNESKVYLYLYEDGEFCYDNSPGLASGYIGYYTFDDNNLILHAVVKCANDIGRTITSDVIKLKINSDNSITDSNLNAVLKKDSQKIENKTGIISAELKSALNNKVLD